MSSSVHDASQVILNQKADKQPDGGYLVGGRTLQADLTYVTAGARPNTSDLAGTAPLDSKGFIKVPCLSPLALSLPSPPPPAPTSLRHLHISRESLARCHLLFPAIHLCVSPHERTAHAQSQSILTHCLSINHRG